MCSGVEEGEGGMLISQTIWEYFMCMVSGDIKHKIKTNRCWCSCNIFSQEKFLCFILPFSFYLCKFWVLFLHWGREGEIRSVLGLESSWGKEMYFCIILSWKGKWMSSVTFWASSPTTRTCAAKHCQSNVGRCLSVQKRCDFRHSFSSGLPSGRFGLMGFQVL